MKQGDNGGYLVTQVYMLNGGNPISSLDNGAKYSCAVSNPAISGNTVTKDFFLNVRCKSIYNFKWKGLSSAQCVNHKMVHLMYWKFLKIYKHKHIIESERHILLTFNFLQLLLSLTQRLVTFL